MRSEPPRGTVDLDTMERFVALADEWRRALGGRAFAAAS
jgi:hypothetical protein